MAKLILILSTVFIFSCATRQEENLNYTLEMQGKLFSSQALVEKLQKSKDPLFIDTFTGKCLDDWNEAVTKEKTNLKTANSTTRKLDSWFALGSCYLLVNQFKMSLFYYDLYLSGNDSNKYRKSIVMQNIGQIYELKSQPVMAMSFYNKSLDYDRKNSQVIFLMALNNLRTGNYAAAIKRLSKLQRSFTQSQSVSYALGVSFYLAGSDKSLRSKVISKLNEKDKGRIIFEIALMLKEKKATKEMINDLKDIEFDFAFMNDFNNIIKKRFNI